MQRRTTPSHGGWRRRVTTSALAVLTAVALTASPLLVPEQASEQFVPQAAAAPCPDGSQTCAPQPTQGGGPTQGNQVPTTAPQAPQTTVPGQAPDTGLQAPTQSGNTPTVQGDVPTMPTVAPTQSDCIVNCPTPTQAPPQTQAPSPDPSPSAAPTSDNTSTRGSQEEFAKKCAEAAAQLSSYEVPQLLVQGGGRSAFSRVPMDPRPADACEGCVNKSVDSSNKTANEIFKINCQRTGDAVFQRIFYDLSKPLSGSTPLGTDTQTWSTTTTNTNVGPQWTISNTTGGKISGSLGFLGTGVEGEGSTAFTFARTGGRLDVAESSGKSVTRDPTKLFPGVSPAEYSSYPVMVLPMMYQYSVPVSCNGKPQTLTFNDLRSVVTAVVPHGNGTPVVLSTIGS